MIHIATAAPSKMQRRPTRPLPQILIACALSDTFRWFTILLMDDDFDAVQGNFIFPVQPIGWIHTSKKLESLESRLRQF